MNEKIAVKRLFKDLAKSKRVRFPRIRGKIPAPNEQGVYIIYNPEGKVVHVGRTPSGRNGLRQRLGNHLHNASSFTAHYLNGRGSKLRNGYRFRYIVVSKPRL
jgi:hypothetical protein